MNAKPTISPTTHVPPPPKHQMAVMIWVAVLPTLIVLQLLLHGLLAGAPMLLRTLVLVTIAVPIVVFALMPPLQRMRAYLIVRRNPA
jgi:antibiotic biosynthesis monooxygenase (ABM) superfamily enzyme